ncbi:MAG: hypothetical protein V2A53_08950 [bacterium]
MGFTLIYKATNTEPHLFRAFRYDHTKEEIWSLIVEDFCRSQRLDAQAFQQVSEAGFNGESTQRLLNEYGLASLPQLPDDPTKVTQAPVITDLTELIALNSLLDQEHSLKFPYPRVLHKETFRNQHHGIDMLAYKEQQGNFSLYIVEVMASAENAHPPKTVKDHYRQILPETLDQERASRLLDDLRTIHAEAREEHDKEVLNGFIIVVLTGQLADHQAVVATPVLIRPRGLFDEKDWKPFAETTHNFEKARISSKVWFTSVELLVGFSDLYNYLLSTLGSKGNNRLKENEVE